jgi:TRAP-type C4-dicarboxylate transport system permease small subunit
MSDDHHLVHQKKFDRLLARLEARLPDRLARAMAWLISPSAAFLRLPLGILFVIGGIFSFLPVLGVWMLPLGILLIAVDVPLVRGWVLHLWPKIEARWRLRTRRKRQAASEASDHSEGR